MDPRFKRIDFESPLFCSQAVSKVNSYLNVDDCSLSSQSSESSQEDSNQENDDDFWSKHNENVKANDATYELDDLSNSLRQYLRTRILPKKLIQLPIGIKVNLSFLSCIDCLTNFCVSQRQVYHVRDCFQRPAI